MERWLTGFWYGSRPVPWLLRPLATLFGGIVQLRRAAYRRGLFRSVRLSCPVIVIGNLTVGGTGKTPLTLWLVQRLQRLGLRPGVVLRGYGGSFAQQAAAVHVEAQHTAAQIGDEALLLAQRTGCAVAVGRDRVAAARLLQQQGAQLIVADDGLQHLRLQRDVEIAVVDGERGFGNGRLLPAGPLREPVARLDTVSLTVQNGGTRGSVAGAPGALRMQVAGVELQRVDGMGAAQPLADWRGRTVHALAAIGNPQRFFALLRDAGLVVRPHPLPDHQALQPADLHFDDSLPVLMTEKDAVKCRGFAQAAHWYLPVTAQFDAADERRLLEKIIMDARLLDLLVCPLCKGPLLLDKPGQQLICRAERLSFPIRDGIPVMLEEEAQLLPSDDPRLER